MRSTHVFKSAIRSAVALSAAGLLVTGAAQAAPIQMQGNFLWTQISDDGTLGNGSDIPGLIHDATGTGTFDTAQGDYLRPGIPFEGFGVSSDQTGVIGNRNNNGDGGGAVGGRDAFAQTSLTDLSAGTLNHVRWTGTAAGMFNIEHNFLFNDGDENISVRTILTALTTMTNVQFARAIDPDPDNYTGGTSDTRNERGLDLNNDGDYDDADEQSQQDFVSAEGSISGLAMAMFTNSAISHNTGIVADCCDIIDPSQYLSGGDFAPILGGFDSDDDHGIGLGFNIGDMSGGEQVVIEYAYVFGDTIGTVDIPNEIPEPSMIALFGLGLAGLGYMRRRKSV